MTDVQGIDAADGLFTGKREARTREVSRQLCRRFTRQRRRLQEVGLDTRRVTGYQIRRGLIRLWPGPGRGRRSLMFVGLLPGASVVAAALVPTPWQCIAGESRAEALPATGQTIPTTVATSP